MGGVGSCGKKERGKSVCALYLCKEKKGEARGVQKTIHSSSSSHHRFPHQTPHSTPGIHSPAASCGICRVNSSAINNHAIVLGVLPPLLEKYQISSGKPQRGMFSLDFDESKTTLFQLQQLFSSHYTPRHVPD